MRSDRILHDFIRRLGASQEELARTKARLAQVEQGLHPGAETETLRDQLREAKVELQIVRDQRDGAQMSVAKMAGELTDELVRWRPDQRRFFALRLPTSGGNWMLDPMLWRRRTASLLREKRHVFGRSASATLWRRKTLDSRPSLLKRSEERPTCRMTRT